ncbi:MAG: hypothetical protein H7296_04520 [Bacteroidia bacterium]|nr:hypothetical protein [Bacteroidia bacterium]
MSQTEKKTKNIIVEKAPLGDNLSMTNVLGFTVADYEPLVDALNTEFGTQVTAADIEPLQTVKDVVVYMESIITSINQSPDSYTV